MYKKNIRLQGNIFSFMFISVAPADNFRGFFWKYGQNRKSTEKDT